MSPQSINLTLRDNTQVHLLAWGTELKTTPCVLLHGFTNDCHVWDELAVVLSKTHPVYALDFRGHGDSDWSGEETYNHETLATDVDDVLERLQLTRIHLIGHSLGARIGMLWAHQHSKTLASFSIIDTGPEVRAAGVSKVRKDAEAMPTEFESPESYVALMQKIYFLGDRNSIQKMAAHNLRRRDDGLYEPKTDPAFTTALWNPNSYNHDASDLKAPLNEKLWEALASITVPTLIMKGKISAILAKRTANKMLETIPNSQLIYIDGAGHALMMDNPTDFIQQQVTFIKKTSGNN